MNKATGQKSESDQEHRTLRHAMLLVVLLVMILLGPLAGADLNMVIFLGAMAVVAVLLDGWRHRTKVAVTIIAMPVITLVAIQFLPQGSRWRVLLLDDWPAIVYQILLIGVIVYCGWLILKSLLMARSVSANEILGAISLYLVIALVWSFSFDLLERAEPGSFNLIDPAEQAASLEGDHRDIAMQFLYFSLVTQSSTGYGDITPASTLAQRMVAIQAVMGQFYMAVVVAYLISLFMVQRRENNPSSGRSSPTSHQRKE